MTIWGTLENNVDLEEWVSGNFSKLDHNLRKQKKLRSNRVLLYILHWIIYQNQPPKKCFSKVQWIYWFLNPYHGIHYPFRCQHLDYFIVSSCQLRAAHPSSLPCLMFLKTFFSSCPTFRGGTSRIIINIIYWADGRALCCRYSVIS